MTTTVDTPLETVAPAPQFPTFEGTDEERLAARAYDGILMPIGRSSDPVIMWYRDNPGEVSRARQVFNEVAASGALLYKTEHGTGDGEQIREFDETAEQIVTVPRLVGG